MIRRPLVLGLVLAAFFALFTAGLSSRPSPPLACLLLFGAVAVFRLMAGFEKGR